MNKYTQVHGLTKLRLVTPPIAIRDEPIALVSTIGYDPECDAYYVSADNEGISIFENKPLPANFHTHELMSVDPSDRDAMLEFQHEWGLLTSPRREPLRIDTIGTPAMTMATPIDGMSSEESLAEADRLYRHLCDRHEDFKRLSSFMITHAEGRNGAYVFAPAGEAEATLAFLQSTAKKLVEAHTVGFDNRLGIEGRKLRAMVADIDAAIEPYYPRYRMFEPSEEDESATPPVLPLTIAVLAQILSYVASDEGYRECRQCHRYFLYKRHTTGEFVRNRRSIYCSDECKARASSSAQAARRRAARLAQGKDLENGGAA